MRKKFFIPLIVAAGVLVVGTAPTLSDYKKVEADTLTTYIEMNKDAFTVPSDAEAAGVFEPSTATYWPTYAGYHDEDGDSFNYSFFALDTFFCGERREGQTIDLTLNSWIQKTQYIYFTWGGAKNDGEDVRLVFHYGEYSSQMLNDTSMGNPMLLRYFKIPDEQYALLNKETGFNMYIELIDNRTGNYGFHNFGYLHVNQTKEQVGDAMRFYINNLVRRHNGSNDVDTRRSQIRIRKEILNHYFGNSYLRDVFYASSSNIDEDFENNNDFLNHWYFDFNYANDWTNGDKINWDMHFDQAIGSDTFRPDNATKMPFNLTDSGFFRGWHENDTLGGFVGGDNSIYRFISRPFVLSGTGLVSIKMAGTASLHVIDPNTKQDLAWADCQTFNTSGNQADLMDGSFNTVTMVRHVINLEAYVGKKIQLAIADVSDGGWSALYADELITNYPTFSGFKVDAFNQTNDGGSHDIYKADRYINATQFVDKVNPNGMRYVNSADINKEDDNAILNHVDSSEYNEAFNFLDGEKGYYSVLRSAANEFNYANANANDRNAVLNKFITLSANAQAVVNSSKDILSATSVSQNIGVAFGPYFASFDQFDISFNANGGTGDAPAALTVVNSTVYKLPDNPFTAPAGQKFAGWKVNNAGDLLEPQADVTITADAEIYAIWEDTNRTKVESLATRTTLSYKYTDNGDGTFGYSNVKIRFGGFVTKALWEALNSDSEIVGYGVMVSLAENQEAGFLGSRTFEEVYAAALTAAGDNIDDALTAMCEGGKIKNFPTSVSDMPYLYLAAESDVTEDTYSWNLVQSVNSPSSLKRTYAAVAYIRTNEGIVFMNESRASAKGLAQAMIDDDGNGLDGTSYGGSLGYLAGLE